MLSKFLIQIFLFFVLVNNIHGSHFLGGTITWRIQNIYNTGTSVAILITQTYSWTYVTGRCDNSSIANNQPVAGASGTLSCSPSCPTGFGALSAIPYCTDVSPLNGIAVGQRLDTVVIPAGSDFYVLFTGGSWNALISGASTWSVTSRINLARRSDNNMFNNAPVATVMSPINIQVNQTTIIPVSVSDADADIVRCRWANASGSVNECGSVCPPGSLPANTVLYSNCTIEITGPIVGIMYAVAFIVEDFISASSVTPLSSVPIQFIVKVIAPLACSILPQTIFIGQSCTTIQVNQTFTSELLAINNCGVNVTIVDIATLSFSGMLQSSVIQLNSSTYYKTLTWTPTIDQLGYQVMCAMALSSQNAQSPQYCFTFYVTENGANTCPGVTTSGIVTIIPLTTTEAPISKSINWAIIGSISGLVLLLAIIGSSCILYRYHKCLIGRRRNRFYNHKPVDNNTSSLPSTGKHPPTDLSSDLVYNIKNEPLNRLPISQIHSNDEKTIVDDNDLKQTCEPEGIYPSSNTIQMPSNESQSYIQPYRASTKMKNEKIQVKKVSSFIEQMMNESHVSQIETIDLSPINVKSEQLHGVDNHSIKSSNIVQLELVNMMKNKNQAKTSNIPTISEFAVETPRKANVKHKKLSGIHVTIRNPPRFTPSTK